MGFSGGGSNVLKPHKHDGTVAQDGGPLDFDNITQADLTAGDVVFSDGVHLQRLPIGTPSQGLQVSGANLPAWAAAGGASFNNQSTNLASTFSTSSTGFTGVTGLTHTGTQASGYSNVTFVGSVSANDAGHVIEARITKDGAKIVQATYEGTEPQNGYKNFVHTFWVTSDTVDFDFDVLISNGAYIMYVQGGATIGSSFSLMEVS